METLKKFSSKGRLNLSLKDGISIINDLLDDKIINDSFFKRITLLLSECQLFIVTTTNEEQLFRIVLSDGNIYKYILPDKIWDKHTANVKIYGTNAYSSSKRGEIVKKAKDLGYERIILDSFAPYYMSNIRNYARATQFLIKRNAL